MKLEGLQELDRWFAQATGSLERRALRVGVRRGARVIATDAKRRVPVETGDLKRSIIVKADATAARANRGEITAVVTFKRPEGSHAHLVERGHDVVRDGVVVGQAAPKPFLRPARETKKAQVRSEVEKKVREWIQKQKAKKA